MPLHSPAASASRGTDSDVLTIEPDNIPDPSVRLHNVVLADEATATVRGAAVAAVMGKGTDVDGREWLFVTVSIGGVATTYAEPRTGLLALLMSVSVAQHADAGAVARDAIADALENL